MKIFYFSITFALTIFSWLVLQNPAGSQSQTLQVTGNNARTYVPPQRGRRAQRTEGAGSRGNCQKNVSLFLLAPSDHVGQTTLGHPTFLWYISSIDVPIRFTLTEPKVAEPMVDLVVPIQEPGLVRFSLPKDSQELVPDREYRWTVTALCNSRRPSDNIYAYANIVRVASSQELEQRLTSLTLLRDRAQLYATKGLWYDAIDTAYSSYQTNKDQPLTSSFFWGLLEEVGISEEMLSRSSGVAGVQNINKP